MAIRIPIITDLQDQGIKNAKIAFGNFKSAVKDAEGGLGKFKAGSKSILDSVSANAGSFALAGAAAFGAFAKSGVDAFQTLAIESGKFADATGLAVDDASRWKEVAGDIGVGPDSVEGAIGKMNATLGKSPQLFKDLGIEVDTTDGFTTDVNGTFLNVIDRLQKIKDPAEKARVATKLLGRGWRDMAELINVGSDRLKSSLAGVSDAKTISPAELQRAKDYRAAQDNLKDTFEDLSITLGEKLVPVLTTVVENFGKIAGAKAPGGSSWFGHISDAAGLFVNVLTEGPIKAFQEYRKETDDAGTSTQYFVDDIKDLVQAAKGQAIPQIDKLAQKLIDAKTATDNAKAAWSNLIGQFERQVSFDKLDTDIDTLKEKAIAAFGGGKKEMDDFHEAQLIVAQDFEKMVEKFPPELSTKISIAIDSGDLAQLAWAAGTVKFLGNPIGSGGNDASIYRRVENQSIPHRALGGPVMGGKSYLVGERGPELFTPGTSGGITPNNALGGGANITVNVMSADPNEVVRALQTYNRNIGLLPVRVQ